MYKRLKREGCSCKSQLSQSGSLQPLTGAEGLALPLIPLASPPCLQPPAPKTLRAPAVTRASAEQIQTHNLAESPFFFLLFQAG